MPDPCSPRLTIEIANRQQHMPVDEDQLREAVCKVVTDAKFLEGELSVAIVDNAEIHELNRRFLEHDYPTDVISFPLEVAPPRLDGEIVASAEMALASAAEIGWPAEAELLLYVVHGALHLVGHDDHDAERAVEMRAAEQYYLDLCGIAMPPAARNQASAESRSAESTSPSSIPEH